MTFIEPISNLLVNYVLTMSRPRPTFLLPLVIISLVGLLAACRGDDTGTSQFIVDEQVQATCSEDCVNHGQCGTVNDGTRVVLAMDGGPAVTLHDRFFPDGVLVTVLELSERELTPARNGVPISTEATPFPHTFYRVSGEGKMAWVSEWCLERP